MKAGLCVGHKLIFRCFDLFLKKTNISDKAELDFYVLLLSFQGLWLAPSGRLALHLVSEQ